MELIVLLFYRKRLLELLTFSHITRKIYPKIFILKFLDKVNLENTFFVSKSINSDSPSFYNDWFLFSSDQRNYENSWFSHGNLPKPSYKTKTYGILSL